MSRRRFNLYDEISSSFIVAVDQQEGAPYTFDGFETDADRGGLPLVIRTETKHLKTGDYSIVGFEDSITIERKTLGDLFGSVSGGRDRFKREHERMQAMIAAGGYASVIIEATIEEAVFDPPEWSDMDPKAVFRTFLSWSQKFGVPWEWAGDRWTAERIVYRRLEKFWQHQQGRINDDRQCEHETQPQAETNAG